MREQIRASLLRRNDVIEDPYVPDQLLKVVHLDFGRYDVIVSLAMDHRQGRAIQKISMQRGELVTLVERAAEPGGI